MKFQKKYFFLFIIPVTALCVFFSCVAKKENKLRDNSAVTTPKENYDPPANITEGLNIGNKAPELAWKDPKDSTVSLSSLKGYYVLIDFWASWCGPCRGENPNVVAAYKKYSQKRFVNGKGFRVFNVSLDYNKTAWQSAIRKDSLNWPYHISDLKGWQTELGSKYGVNQIPANWLIDSRGIIVARGLRGEKLDLTLDKYVDTTKIVEPVLKENKKKNKK